jgi:CubicO group peptidase (beta-lactamase class C family)
MTKNLRVFSYAVAMMLGTVSTAVMAQAEQPAANNTDATPIDVAGDTATIGVPPGWVQSRSGTATILTAPEGDFMIGLVPVYAASDPKDAVSKAWAQVKPGFARPVRLSREEPGRDGWDSIHDVSYDIPPADKQYAFGSALKKGDVYTVVVGEGAIATLSKRGGQLGQLAGSLRPKGFSKESFAGMSALPLNGERIAEIKRFTLDAMKTLKIPGVGLALIENGRIIYEGGLGVKDIQTGAPVDQNTQFMIASNTKGMATLLLATLVDEGKLDWNRPVTEYMPEFRLGSAETTKKVLVKHLVCACTGLPRKDMQWLFNTKPGTPANDTFVQLAATEPTSGFGEVYQYNNLMASAAGYLAARIIYPKMELGAAFDRAMQERIFNPLDMKSTTLSNRKAVAGNWAKPYDTDLYDKLSLVDMAYNDTVVPYRPAGGAWSTAHDMANYVMNELSEGMLPSGKRMVSADNLLIRRARGVPTGEKIWYGMGLEDDATFGVSVIQHGGSMFGYKSNWFAIPSAGVGMVVLTNSEYGYPLADSLKRKLQEVLYNGRSEAAEDVVSTAARRAASEAKLRSQLVYPVPAASSATLIGSYSNPELGPLKISSDGDRLILRATSIWSELATKPNEDGTTSIVTISPGIGGENMLIGNKNGVVTLTLNDGQHDYVWQKD